MDTFEDRNTKHSAQENEEDLQKQTNGDKKESRESQPHNELIGLTGGQPKDDDSGLDVSDYTGPHSKAGAVFDDAERPAETEAKLNKEQAPDSSEWENPDPKDNSGV